MDLPLRVRLLGSFVGVDLVGDLLNMARMEEGTVRRQISPLHIEDILNEVKELMQPVADRNRICLEVQASDRLPDVNADREELIRLFNNLVDNAIKYNKPEGRVKITGDQDGPYVRVSVTDTGIGIGKESRSRLFSEFFREKRGEASLITGTGLGLSIVKRIVDFYHGRVEVESELEKGSVFTVWLPHKGSSQSMEQAESGSSQN
ncbi:MAG: HAMP domain-containing sensor histidine kinase [Desulfobacterales bacterium]